ncbi:MAG: hypothetical protein K2Q22_09485, partial [Cytophagales bacterium]|nr:hypothetical protein [Cytophagales bacterium]
MKNTLINHSLLQVCIALLMVLGACSPKSNDPTPSTPVSTGTVYFHLHNYISDTEVDGYGFVYQNGDGRKIALTKAQFYFSNFQ